MATQTSGNLRLSKPAYTDAADINVINGNMDKIDTSITAEAESVAIVSRSNTHDSIPAGSYVYVMGHSTLAEGLYRANSLIGQNGSLTTSNLTAISGGGLNDLEGKFNGYVSSGILADNSDLNSVITPGTYNLSSSRTYTNLPSGTFYMLKVYMPNATGQSRLQIVYGTHMCLRFRTGENAWGSWRRLTTTPDDMTVPSIRYFTVTSNSSITLHVENSTRAMIQTIGGSTNVHDLISVYSTSSGGLYVARYRDASQITISTAANALTITSGSTAFRGYVTVYTGDITETT